MILSCGTGCLRGCRNRRGFRLVAKHGARERADASNIGDEARKVRGIQDIGLIRLYEADRSELVSSSLPLLNGTINNTHQSTHCGNAA